MTKQKFALSGLIVCLTLSGLALTTTGCAGTRYQRSTGAYLDDKAIGTRVKTALFRDSMVSGFDVGVNTFRGEVQLTGFVDTPEQKDRAEQIARETSGVRYVVNNLELKPASAVGAPAMGQEGSSRTITEPVPEAPAADTYRLDDSQLRQDLRQDLRQTDESLERAADRVDSAAARAERAVDSAADPSAVQADRFATQGAAALGAAQPSNLEINAANGVATIRGTVSSESQRQTIERQVRQIPGIQNVENRLEVRQNQ